MKHYSDWEKVCDIYKELEDKFKMEGKEPYTLLDGLLVMDKWEKGRENLIKAREESLEAALVAWNEIPHVRQTL
uniref:Uncharacterized protein n=1 Tax=viral metagenome TaxID=1070528 RepID=A0A6H1ZCD6_9ZZZZ